MLKYNFIFFYKLRIYENIAFSDGPFMFYAFSLAMSN